MGNREEFQLGSCQFSASNIITHLEVPAIGPYSSLWDVMHADKLEVQWPYAMVLCDGKCSKGTIEGPSGASYFGLVYEELAIVQPDPRHLQTTRVELEYNLGRALVDKGFCVSTCRLALSVMTCRCVLSLNKCYLYRCYSSCRQGNLCVDMSFIPKCHDISTHIVVDKSTKPRQWNLETMDSLRSGQNICLLDHVDVNSLKPGDAMWWNKSGTILHQVMACQLMAPC